MTRQVAVSCAGAASSLQALLPVPSGCPLPWGGREEQEEQWEWEPGGSCRAGGSRAADTGKIERRCLQERVVTGREGVALEEG